MRCNRREFSAALAAVLAVPTLPLLATEVRGVTLGLQTYAFHQVHEGGLAAVDTMTASMRTLNIDLCELWSPQIEPFPLPFTYWGRFSPGAVAPPKPTPETIAQRRDALRAWRVNPPAGQLEAIRTKFKDAGIRIFAYNYSFQPTMTDAEIDAGFIQAKILGVNLITASSKISMAKRVAPFAAKHNMRVAFHGHASKDPDEVSSPDSFAAVVAMSPLYRINLDVGHFASAGYDAVAFLNANHEKITNLHVHDRLINDGESVPMGEGVAPIRQVLLLVRDKGWKIPVFYEMEHVNHAGRDVVAEVAHELAYERKVLES